MSVFLMCAALFFLMTNNLPMAIVMLILYFWRQDEKRSGW